MMDYVTSITLYIMELKRKRKRTDINTIHSDIVKARISLVKVIDFKDTTKNYLQKRINIFMINEKQWRYWGGALGSIAPPSRESLPFLKEYKNESLLFVLSHLNFCPTVEKCYYLPILLKISIEAVKITHNESFKDNGCSIAI